MGMQKPQATVARHVFVTHGGRQRWKAFIPIRRDGLAPCRGTLPTLEWRFSLMAPSAGIAGFGVASLAENSSSVYAPGLLKAVEAARNLAAEVAN